MNRVKPEPCCCSTSRRTLLADAAVVLCAAALPALRPARAAAAEAAEAPMLAESDPAAVAVSYVEDANRAKDAQPGASCSNCVLYKDAPGTGLGDCRIFPGKWVKAAGWCSSWSDL
jgi:hypothetical protein